MRAVGGERNLFIDYKSGFKLNGKESFQMKIKVMNLTSDIQLLEKEMVVSPSTWHILKLNLGELKKNELIKVLMKTDYLCLKDQNLSEDFRNLGIAIREIRLT